MANFVWKGRNRTGIVQEGTMAHVTYGTLVDPPTLQLQAHICVALKAPWDTICDGLPQHKALPA